MKRHSLLAIVTGLIAICAMAEIHAANQKEANDAKPLVNAIVAKVDAYERDGKLEKPSAAVYVLITELGTLRDKAWAQVADDLSKDYPKGSACTPLLSLLTEQRKKARANVNDAIDHPGIDKSEGARVFAYWLDAEIRWLQERINQPQTPRLLQPDTFCELLKCLDDCRNATTFQRKQLEDNWVSKSYTGNVLVKDVRLDAQKVAILVAQARTTQRSDAVWQFYIQVKDNNDAAKFSKGEYVSITFTLDKLAPLGGTLQKINDFEVIPLGRLTSASAHPVRDGMTSQR